MKVRALPSRGLTPCDRRRERLCGKTDVRKLCLHGPQVVFVVPYPKWMGLHRLPRVIT